MQMPSFNPSAANIIYCGICRAQEPVLSNKVRILGKKQKHKHREDMFDTWLAVMHILACLFVFIHLMSRDLTKIQAI